MSDENKKNNNVTPEDVSDKAQEEYKVSVSAADLLADVISDEKNAKKEKTPSFSLTRDSPYKKHKCK